MQLKGLALGFLLGGLRCVLIDLLMNGNENMINVWRNHDFSGFRVDANQVQAIPVADGVAQTSGLLHERHHEAGEQERLLLVERRLDCHSFVAEDHHAETALVAGDSVYHFVNFERLAGRTEKKINLNLSDSSKLPSRENIFRQPPSKVSKACSDFEGCPVVWYRRIKAH